MGHRKIDGWRVTQDDLLKRSSYAHHLRAVCIPRSDPGPIHLVDILSIPVPDDT